MAILTTKGVNGILAILEIAKASEVSPITIKEISEKTGISKNYMQQILDPLREEGIIGALKGKSGGYFLAKKPSEIKFYDIFVALEKDVKITNLIVKNEPIKKAFDKFDREIKEVLSLSLEDFYKQEEDNRKFLNFVI
ncbi:RrF2 family transcriptional regulator [Campylobacter geochelonis]|uniref:BadM/Rrf2 family transcriptional regulator n=1 Tax=Campylobacter geochelonis TaxID=1780362 RepID=A0A128EG30_9BACT|nr:Rrf2 family transcriptional regulator [Campylobacter geochelonis]QKF71456.1 transcriptional regulator, IscR/Rrf2 family [Campylobacter geochelonis]CZE47875.1 BadM/Rrf2 family transcriptional regulator [Campylobacter geochelonis]CZE48310.1 BadM/Rrf2 family transcriptional regulator [Campylobacter geochelonis]CZE50829.1 BadM/Rrf2 family transcriptional regulator [Campylobacter geochelonis]